MTIRAQAKIGSGAEALYSASLAYGPDAKAIAAL